MKRRRFPRRELPDVRQQFVRMMDEGLPKESIKTALKLGKSTFYQWKKKYLTGGAEALKVRPIPGGTPAGR